VTFNPEEKETEEELGKKTEGQEKRNVTNSPLATRAHTFYCQTHMET